MHNTKDISGQTFGRLYVISRFGTNKAGLATWLCRCSCSGKELVVAGVYLRRAHEPRRSCGCIQKEKAAVALQQTASKHRMHRTPEHVLWSSIKWRCRPGAEYWRRGIAVCEKWSKSFLAFFADVGKKPGPDYSLDRIDNNKGYEPGNVRWATRSEQARNTSKTHYVTVGRERLSIADWAERIGVSRELIYDRISSGWSDARAVTTPRRAVHRGSSESDPFRSEKRSWQHMIDRCTNPKNRKYPRYGGRGIAVCKRWLNSQTSFLEDMGPKPSPAHTLDRINNSAHYTPQNCRWADSRQQAANRSTTRRIRYRGEVLCLREWAERFGLSDSCLRARLKKGWPICRALVTPPKAHQPTKVSGYCKPLLTAV
jgi:hypothetical protein